MSRGLRWFKLAFPSTVEPEQVDALLRAVHGLSNPGRRETFVFQLVGRDRVVEHWLGLPVRRAPMAERQALHAVPGLVLTEADAIDLTGSQSAWRVWLSTDRRALRTTDPVITSGTLLTALASARPGELISLQWILGPVRRPLAVATKHEGLLPEAWPAALASAAAREPQPPDSEARQSLREKQSGAGGWRATGRIAIRSDDQKRRMGLLGGVLGALRTADGPSVQLGVRPSCRRTVLDGHLPWRWPLALSVTELIGLIGWPLGEEVGDLPVSRRRSRLLPARSTVPRHGRVIAVEPSTEHPLAISVPDSLLHSHFAGPTGTGKSTALLNLIVQDMLAGRAIAVLEPKSDLIQAVLARVPQDRLDDVVLLDPTDDVPVGFNPLQGASPDLAADQLLSIFQALNADSWGPRLSDALHASLLSLARTPRMSLAALPLLLEHDGFRRRIVGGLDDPLGVSPFWAAYERLSPEARAQVIAPVLNKVRPLIGRPALRGVLGQVEPRFSLRSLFMGSGRPILLANLAKGSLGPDSAKLLGTLLLNQLWQTALARGEVTASRRYPVMVYVDELQDYAGLPGDLAEILSQSRGLGVGWHLAHQYLSQLPPDLRAGVLSQARNRIVFQQAGDDAAVFARDHRELTSDDFKRLPVREVYLQLAVNSEVQPYASGRTVPPPETTIDPRIVAAASRQRWGVPRTETDAAIRALIETEPLRTTGTSSGIGGRRRRS